MFIVDDGSRSKTCITSFDNMSVHEGERKRLVHAFRICDGKFLAWYDDAYSKNLIRRKPWREENQLDMRHNSASM